MELPESQLRWNSGHKLSIEVEAQPEPQETIESHKNHAKSVSRVKHRQVEGTEPNKGIVRERKRASPADSRRTNYWQGPWSTVTSHSTNHTVSERRHGRGDTGKGAGEGGRAKEPATRDALRGAKLSAFFFCSTLLRCDLLAKKVPGRAPYSQHIIIRNWT